MCSISFFLEEIEYSKICNTMTSGRLKGISLIHFHQEIIPGVEKVADLFAVTNGRLSTICFLLVFNQYVLFALKIKQQPTRGVPMKMFSENLQQFYGKTPMLKRDFALQLY